MLTLILNDKCNNDCVFCKDHFDVSYNYIQFDKLATALRGCESGTKIDLFGCEPSLYPFFLDTLKLAKSLGLKCSVASNARAFSNLELVKQMKLLGVEQIRTTLHGHTANIHDHHTRRKGSYKQTIKGIENIVKEKIDLWVNTVITEVNYPFLVEITNFVADLGVMNHKFSSLINGEKSIQYVPNNNKVRSCLEESIDLIIRQGRYSVIEKSPLCLTPSFFSLSVYEPDDGAYIKPSRCKFCSLAMRCNGVSREQVALYGEDIVLPFRETIGNSFKVQESLIISNDVKILSWCDTHSQDLYVRILCENRVLPESFFQIIKLIKSIRQDNYHRSIYIWISDGDTDDILANFALPLELLKEKKIAIQLDSKLERLTYHSCGAVALSDNYEFNIDIPINELWKVLVDLPEILNKKLRVNYRLLLVKEWTRYSEDIKAFLMFHLCNRDLQSRIYFSLLDVNAYKDEFPDFSTFLFGMWLEVDSPNISIPLYETFLSTVFSEQNPPNTFFDRFMEFSEKGILENDGDTLGMMDPFSKILFTEGTSHSLGHLDCQSCVCSKFCEGLGANRNLKESLCPVIKKWVTLPEVSSIVNMSK